MRLLSRRRIRAGAATGLLLAVWGCGDAGPSENDAPGPRLVAVDSVRLQEPDDRPLQEPYALLVDPFDGSLLFPDFGGGSVLRFARDGTLQTVYGRPGEGPGELERPTATLVLDHRTVAVHDNADHTVSLFERRTGEFRTSEPLPGGGGGGGSTVPAVVAGSVFFPMAPPGWIRDRSGSVESVLVWEPGSGTRFIGSMPSEFSAAVARSQWLYPNLLLQGALAIGGGRVFRGWPIRNDIWVQDLEGSVRDTLNLPVVRRRGVPPDLPSLLGGGELGPAEITEISSRLHQLHVMPEGLLATTHHDREVVSGAMPGDMTTESTVWVGVVDPEGHQACMDALLPTSADATSLEGFRADTLFQLDRRIVGGGMETWVRLYRVDVDSCDWWPMP